MASPDFREYIDLTVHDRQPSEIYQDSIDYARVAVPELDIRPGTVEDALFQAMAYVSGETIASINRLPNGLMEGILKLFGFSRLSASFATATVAFSIVDSNGIVIPAGTQVGYTSTVDGVSTFHTFSTTSDIEVTSGSSTSGAVEIIADLSGVKPSITAGTNMVIVTTAPRLLSATLDSDLVNGASSEADNAYFGRGTTFLGGLSNALTTVSQMQARVLTDYPDVHRCKFYDLTQISFLTPSDLTRDGANEVTVTLASGHGITTGDAIRIVDATPSSFDGDHVVTGSSATTVTFDQSGDAESSTVHGTLFKLNDLDLTASDIVGSVVGVVCLEDGNRLPLADITLIQEDISDKSVAGLEITLIHPIIVPFDVGVTIRTTVGFSTVTVGDAVDLMLTDLLSTNGWLWDDTVRRNYIVARVSQIAGVEYVTDVTITLDPAYSAFATVSSGDLEFTHKGALPLANVTVSEAV